MWSRRSSLRWEAAGEGACASFSDHLHELLFERRSGNYGLLWVAADAACVPDASCAMARAISLPTLSLKSFFLVETKTPELMLEIRL